MTTAAAPPNSTSPTALRLTTPPNPLSSPHINANKTRERTLNRTGDAKPAADVPMATDKLPPLRVAINSPGMGWLPPVKKYHQGVTGGGGAGSGSGSRSGGGGGGMPSPGSVAKAAAMAATAEASAVAAAASFAAASPEARARAERVAAAADALAAKVASGAVASSQAGGGGGGGGGAGAYMVSGAMEHLLGRPEVRPTEVVYVHLRRGGASRIICLAGPTRARVFSAKIYYIQRNQVR